MNLPQPDGSLGGTANGDGHLNAGALPGPAQLQTALPLHPPLSTSQGFVKYLARKFNMNIYWSIILLNLYCRLGNF